MGRESGMGAASPGGPGTADSTAVTLPAAVVAALDGPAPGVLTTIEAAGIPFAVRTWGARSDPPLLLLHGVTASSRIWWRVGPGLAAAGRYVVAPDMPGHGLTRSWTGRRAFGETARDIVALAKTAGIVAVPANRTIDADGLAVVGHSWGGMVAAELPAAGLRPNMLVLLDPPALTARTLERMTTDPVERAYADHEEAAAALRSIHPDWSDDDISAKADALCRMEVAAVRSILLENGDWDAGLAALAHPAAADVPAWLIRADPACGGMIPDAAVGPFVERLGADRVVMLHGAAHAPQRLHAAETVAAILRALA